MLLSGEYGNWYDLRSYLYNSSVINPHRPSLCFVRSRQLLWLTDRRVQTLPMKHAAAIAGRSPRRSILRILSRTAARQCRSTPSHPWQVVGVRLCFRRGTSGELARGGDQSTRRCHMTKIHIMWFCFRGENWPKWAELALLPEQPAGAPVLLV